MSVSWSLERRLLVARILLAAVFFSFICIFGYVQIVRSERYTTLSQKNRIRLVWIAPPRGKILDRNGVVMVDNRSSFDVALEFEALKDRKMAVEFLARVFKVEPSRVEEALKNYRGPAFLPIPVKKDVDMATLTQIEEARFQAPSITVEVNPVRKYVLTDRAAALLGYVGAIDREQYQNLKDQGYHWLDVIGKSGIEGACEVYLRGEPGGMQIEVDHRGHREKVLSVKKPIPGRDVYLTIDMKVQEALEEVMTTKVGCGIVMDPKTGEILGMVSRPSFDLNLFIKPDLKGELAKLFKDPLRPLVNRAFQGLYGPGSVFKLVVAAAGLDTGILNQGSHVDCGGVLQVGGALFHCWKELGHGRVSLHAAIQHSCNIFFYHFGQRVGPDRIAQYARRFGLGQTTGVDIGNEREGLVPTSAWKRERFHDAWYGGDTANLSIGQGFISVTALQLANMVSAIANGGKLMTPFVVKKVVSSSGRTLIEMGPRQKGSVGLSERVLAFIREAMWSVVNGQGGTAIAARLDHVQVCGKTGTVQVKQGRDFVKQGWFVGYASYEDPKIVIVLLVEGVESGGKDVAPLAGEVLRRIFKESPTTSMHAEGTPLRGGPLKRTMEVVG